MVNKQIETWKVVTLSVAVFVLVTTMVLGSWVWGTYNKLIYATTDIDTQMSNILTEYQRRADLLLNMAEVAKGYANFEKDTLTQVTQARNINFAGFGQQSTTEQMAQLSQMDSALSRLMLVFEKYPELKTVEQYNKLSEELKRTENRVQIARSDYNNLVRSYNILVQRFPTKILAGTWGYDTEVFFQNEIGTTQAPKLDMSI